MSSTYTDRNKPCFWWTNTHSQFGTFSHPNSYKQDAWKAECDFGGPGFFFEWNHLLRLFNTMSFSMFCCSHFGNFLSDPIGKAESRVKERSRSDFQWRFTDGETQTNGSSDAETHQLGVTQPVEREGKSPAGFGISGKIPRMSDKVVRLVQGTLYGPPKARKSNVLKWGENSDSWKQGDREESSNSANTRRLVRAATPRTGFQKMKYTNHQYMTKVFHVLQKKLGITAGYSTFSMEAWKTSKTPEGRSATFKVEGLVFFSFFFFSYFLFLFLLCSNAQNLIFWANRYTISWNIS